jgi:hypothetical protein
MNLFKTLCNSYTDKNKNTIIIKTWNFLSKKNE